MIPEDIFQHGGEIDRNEIVVGQKHLKLRLELCANCVQIKNKAVTGIFRNCFFFNSWAHLGLNQGPPDYESGALTN